MTFRRIAAFIAAGILVMMLGCVSVVAEEEQTTDSMKTTTKTYSLVMTETAGAITATPDTPAFWEYPLLRAGENFLSEGTMIVRNDGQTVASMVMEPVPIPYGDDAKLTYLDNIILTVSEGETVLFQNTYAHINDAEGGLSLIYNDMAPGEEHIYTIRMKCLFTYPGDVYQDAVPMSWRFSAKVETVTVQEEEKGLDMWLWIILATLAVIILAMVVIMIVQAVLRANMKKKRVMMPVEPAAVETPPAGTDDAADPAALDDKAAKETADATDAADTPQETAENSQENAENPDKPVDKPEDV